jgi:hypothetical protein
MHWQLLTAALIAAAPTEGQPKDEEGIQGTWTMVFREFIDKKTPDADQVGAPRGRRSGEGRG